MSMLKLRGEVTFPRSHSCEDAEFLAQARALLHVFNNQHKYGHLPIRRDISFEPLAWRTYEHQPQWGSLQPLMLWGPRGKPVYLG